MTIEWIYTFLQGRKLLTELLMTQTNICYIRVIGQNRQRTQNCIPLCTIYLFIQDNQMKNA